MFGRFEKSALTGEARAALHAGFEIPAEAVHPLEVPARQQVPQRNVSRVYVVHRQPQPPPSPLSPFWLRVKNFCIGPGSFPLIVPLWMKASIIGGSVALAPYLLPALLIALIPTAIFMLIAITERVMPKPKVAYA